MFRYGVWTVKVSGRNSQYLSHRKVEYSHSTLTPAVLYAANGKFEVFVEPLEDLMAPAAIKVGGFEYRSTWTLVQVPRPVLRPLIDEAERWLGFPTVHTDAPFWEVAVADRIVGKWWEGKPVFEMASLPNRIGDPIEVGGLHLEPIDSAVSLDNIWTTATDIGGVRIYPATSEGLTKLLPPVGRLEGRLIWAFKSDNIFFIGEHKVPSGKYLAWLTHD